MSGQAGAIILGISKALILHDEVLKGLKKTNSPQETQELWNVKNTVTEKPEEVFSFLKGNHLNLTIIKDGI